MEQKDMTPLVSVIVPVYNVSPYISECLESILGQTYYNLEVVLVDDGSTDDSAEICEQYARGDERITLLRQTNQGQASARNKGFRASTGKWICFVDSDDALHPEAVSILLGNALKSNCPISEGAFVEVDSIPEEFDDIRNREYVQYKVDEEQLLKDTFNCWIVCGKLIDRSIIEKNLFTEHRVFEDNAVILRWLLDAGIISRTNEVLYYYRNNPAGTTKRKFSLKKLDYLWALEERMNALKKMRYNKMLERTLLTYINASIKMCRSITAELLDSSVKRRVKYRAFKVTRHYFRSVTHKAKVLKNLGKLLII